MDVIQKETSVVLSDKIGQKIDEIFETNIHLAKEDYAAMTTNDMPENYGSEGLKASVLEVEELMHNITSDLDNKDTVYNFSETEKAEETPAPKKKTTRKPRTKKTAATSETAEGENAEPKKKTTRKPRTKKTTTDNTSTSAEEQPKKKSTRKKKTPAPTVEETPATPSVTPVIEKAAEEILKPKEETPTPTVEETKPAETATAKTEDSKPFVNPVTDITEDDDINTIMEKLQKAEDAINADIPEKEKELESSNNVDSFVENLYNAEKQFNTTDAKPETPYVPQMSSVPETSDDDYYEAETVILPMGSVLPPVNRNNPVPPVRPNTPPATSRFGTQNTPPATSRFGAQNTPPATSRFGGQNMPPATSRFGAQSTPLATNRFNTPPAPVNNRPVPPVAPMNKPVPPVAPVNNKPVAPPAYKPPVPDSNGLVSAHKTTSSEPARKQNPVDLTNVIIDETRTDPIGGVFGLNDEKPLTGSFTLSEKLEDTSQKSADELDVPLEGSFDVEPAKVTVSGKFVENTKPVVTMVDSLNKVPAPQTPPVTSTYKPPVPDSNGLVSAHKTTSNEPARKQNPVDLTNVIIDETRTDPIGGLFGLNDEKPLTGSFTLTEQLEDTSQKSVDELDVPLEGSFDVEPAKVTVSGKFVENTKPVVTMVDSLNKVPAPQTPPATAAYRPPVSAPATSTYKPPVPDSNGLVSAHKTTSNEPARKQNPVNLTNVIIDETRTDPIGGLFGLDDEKPLTGSFTLSEKLEDTSQKSADELDVPLEGSFDVEPAKVTVSGKFVENTKPVVTMVDSLNKVPAPQTPPATSTYKPPVPDSNGLVSAHKTTSNEPARKQNPVDLTNVIIDETRTAPIGGLYGLDDEKPLTGSFTLTEQLEDTSQKSVDELDVPLEGSFDVEPAKITVSGKFVENTKPIVTMASDTVFHTSSDNELENAIKDAAHSPEFLALVKKELEKKKK